MYAAELHQLYFVCCFLSGNWYETVDSLYQITSHTSCSIGAGAGGRGSNPACNVVLVVVSDTPVCCSDN